MERNLAPLTALSYLACLFALLYVIPTEDWASLLAYVPVLILLALLLYHKGIKPIDPHFPASLFWLAFALKMISSIARYWMAFDLYGGAADAGVYHRAAQFVAEFFKEFDFSLFTSGFRVRGQGTTQLVYITGLIYTVLPPSLSGVFFFFAGLAFSGSVFFYRAFRVAFPEAKPRVYRLLVFFLPSILFWPASLGKDAWIFFGSGFVAYGLAEYLRQTRWSGLFWVGIGLFMINLVRPHVALFLLAAAVAAYFFSRRIRTSQRIVGGVTIIAAGFFFLQSSNQNLVTKGLTDVSLDNLSEIQTEVQRRTYKGGSRFTPVSPFTPIGFFYAPITIVFRPFPWEADNAQMMITSLEAMVWLGLFWYRRRVVWSKVRSLGKDPWLTFAIIYSFLTIYSFTTFGNFGILARQRVMFIPFLLVLIS